MIENPLDKFQGKLVTIPAVKSSFKRLVNVGLIQGVVILFDYSKVDASQNEDIIHIQNIKNSSEKNYNTILEKEMYQLEKKIKAALQ